MSLVSQVLPRLTHAQEQVDYRGDENDPEHPLNRDNLVSLKSDIYAFGRLMMTLMNQANLPLVTFTTTEQENRLNDAAEAFYPEPMKIIAKRCTRVIPGTRPPIEEVFNDVRKEIERFPGPNEIPLKLQGRHEGEVILYKPDPYLLWAPEL